MMRLFVSFLALLGFAAWPAAAVPTLAMTHVTVIDGTGAPARPDQIVLIEGDRIAAVGSAADIAVPRGARVFDARGKYLMPGLWDLHVHDNFATPDVLPVFVAYGVTGIRELSTGMKEIAHLRDMGRSGAHVIPNIIAAGNMIEAGVVKSIIRKIAPPIIANEALNDRIFVDTAEEARAAVRSLAARHPDFIKLHVNLKRDIYFAVLDEAHKLNLPVAGHYPAGGERITLRDVAEAGQTSIEHIGFGTEAADFAKLDPAGQKALVELVKARGVHFVPTLVTYGADHKYEDVPTADARLALARKDPRSRYISPQLREAWRAFLTLAENQKSQDVVNVEADRAQALALLRAMHEGGVPILPGTDFTVQFLYPGSSLHEELVELVRQVGMTPSEALQAATRQSAEMLGLQASTGTVEAGKVADLLLLDANPLDDIANTREIRAVVRGGRLFDRRGLDKLLDDAAKKLGAFGT